MNESQTASFKKKAYRSDRLLGAPGHSSDAYRELFPRGVKLNNLHVVPGFIMRGAVLLLYIFMERCLIKRKDLFFVA